MQKKEKNPPGLGSWFIKRLAHSEDNISLSGDLEEVYREKIEEKGRLRAWLWYWNQVVVSLPSNVSYSIRRSHIMFRNYFKIAFRVLRKHSAYSFINVTGLMTGIACFILIGLFVKDELSYDRYHENADNIYRYVLEYTGQGMHTFSLQAPSIMGPGIMEDYPEIINFVRLTRNKNSLISHKEKGFYEDVYFADKSLFDVFSFDLLKGDPKTVLSEPYSMIISEKAAQKYFGEEDPVGKVFSYDNDHAITVTGLMKEIPDNSHFKTDFFVSLSTYLTINDWISDRAPHWGVTYFLVKEGTNISELETKFPDFLTQRFTDHYERGFDFNDTWKIRLQSLKDIHLYSNNQGELEANSDIKYVFIFSAIAVLILLIASINFMNLSTARSSTRAREVGMRKVVGARRGNLINQFLGESVVISVLSTILALIIVEIVLPSYNQLIDKELQLGLFSNPLLIPGLFLFSVSLGLTAGCYPALFLSSFRPIQVLKSITGYGNASFLRSFLVAVQFSVSSILIISTLIVYNQLQFVKNKKLGINKERVVVIKINDQAVTDKIQIFKNELLNNVHVYSVGFSNGMPRYGFGASAVSLEGEKNSRFITTIAVDYDFIESMGIEMAEGRNFSRDKPNDLAKAFILNESAVKAFGWDNAIGNKFTRISTEGRVIGVTKDFHYASLHEKIEPVAFYLSEKRLRYAVIKLRSTNIQEALSTLESDWEKVSTAYPFEYSFLDEDFDRLYKSEQRLANIFWDFTALAIFIACLGLFGLASFTTERRTKEIGVRKVLGASTRRVAYLLSKEFVYWIIVANVIAWPVTFFLMTKWLEGFAYRIELGIESFLFSTLIATIIALLTISYQTIKLALANPIKALRYE